MGDGWYRSGQVHLQLPIPKKEPEERAKSRRHYLGSAATHALDMQ
jgi:hypothetical protein